MALPDKAIFAFNANLDHVRFADEADLAKIEAFSPEIYSQMNECFSWGVQKEIAVDAKACEFFLSEIKFEGAIVGGQAGNAAQQASALGVECLLHTNFANRELLEKFTYPEKIMVAGEQGFAPSTESSSQVKSAHHFVFENKESRTRFIASYDPLPLHLEDSFCLNISARLPAIRKAFIGGLHLVKTPERVGKFAEELRRWKKISPRLQIFLELGEFSDKKVLHAVEKEVFPTIDMLGLNEVELGQLSFELDELPSIVQSVLFHCPQEQLFLPSPKANAAALEFAKRCAAFKAKNGRVATEEDLVGFSPDFVESPAKTIGLGDIFSCAYFLSA